MQLKSYHLPLAVPRESEIPDELTRLERMRVTGGAVMRYSSHD